MPCTLFLGRTQYGFERVVTHDFPSSTGEYGYSKILRKRPEKRVPAETVEVEGVRRKGERDREVEIVVVVEWAVVSVERGRGVSEYGCV